MNKLVNEKGEDIFESKDILECQKDFYQNLYYYYTNIDETPLQDVLGENLTNCQMKNQPHWKEKFSIQKLRTPLKI